MGREEFFATYRTLIQQKLRDEITRRKSISPHLDTENIVALEIDREKEQLEKLMEKTRDASIAMHLREVVDWLPQLSKKLLE